MGLEMSDPARSGDPGEPGGELGGELRGALGGDHDSYVPVHCVVSQSGAYDDKSFIAGYQVGRVDAALWSARRACRAHVTVHHVRADVVTHLDLFAMNAGYVISRVDVEEGHNVETDGDLRTVIFTKSSRPWDRSE